MSAPSCSVAPLLAILLAFPVASAGEDLPAGGQQRHTVRIQSQPGVEILWEGVALGETDAGGYLLIEGIPAGEYRLTLRKEGFHTLDTRMPVAAGASSSRALLLEAVRPKVGARRRSEQATSELARPEQVPGEIRRDHRETPAPVPAGPAGARSLPATGVGTAERSTGAAAEHPADRSVAFSPLLALAALLLALLSGAAGARFLSRSRGGDAVSQAPPYDGFDLPPPSDEMPQFEDRDGPGFLEDLKQREQNFPDRPHHANRRPEETIIEVEAVEISPASVRPGEEA